MSLPDYQFVLRSPLTGDVIRVFDAQSVLDVRYSRILNGIGSLVMTFPATDELPELFPLDALIDVERTSPLTGRLQIEETYLTRLTHRFQEGDQEQIIVGGQSLNHLLSRRIIDPDDDPLQSGGYSTKAGPADSVMRDYALEQCGPSASAARQFPDFTIASVSATGKNIGKRLRHENLYTVLKGIADETGIDFQIVRTMGRELELRIGRIGQDRSKARNYPFSPFTYLTPARGNLNNPSLLLDRKNEKTFVYTLGQGPGDKRIVIKVAGNGISDSPYNRIEFTADGRTNERGNSLAILTDANEALDENKADTEFTFDMEGNPAGNIYRQSWDLGDTVTAAWGMVERDLRVTEVEIRLDPNGETIAISTENANG